MHKLSFFIIAAVLAAPGCGLTRGEKIFYATTTTACVGGLTAYAAWGDKLGDDADSLVFFLASAACVAAASYAIYQGVESRDSNAE